MISFIDFNYISKKIFYALVINVFVFINENEFIADIKKPKQKSSKIIWFFVWIFLILAIYSFSYVNENKYLFDI